MKIKVKGKCKDCYVEVDIFSGIKRRLKNGFMWAIVCSMVMTWVVVLGIIILYALNPLKFNATSIPLMLLIVNAVIFVGGFVVGIFEKELK